MNIRSKVPEGLKDFIGRPLGLRGIAPGQQWQRVVMNRAIDEWIAGQKPETLTAVEVSGRERSHHLWGEYATLIFPEFDLCSETQEIPRDYDVVICEQVLEHVPDPWMALERLAALCSPGGHVVISTPFLIRVHAGPGDYWRFTEDGLRIMVERAGLVPISSGSWGNRRCTRANLRRWAKRRPWSSLRNDPRFPVAVWVIAQRPVVPAS